MGVSAPRSGSLRLASPPNLTQRHLKLGCGVGEAGVELVFLSAEDEPLVESGEGTD